MDVVENGTIIHMTVSMLHVAFMIGVMSRMALAIPILLGMMTLARNKAVMHCSAIKLKMDSPDRVHAILHWM
jgi:hypothetical protein